MSSSIYRKPQYEVDSFMATSSRPLQEGTQIYVDSQAPRPQTSQPIIDLDSEEDTLLPKKPLNEVDMGTLQEELNQLRIRAKQLEARATSAENGYNELWQLRELESQKHLEKYKELAEKRFKASEKEIQTMKDLIKHQERHITQSASRIEVSLAKIDELKKNPPKQIQLQKLRDEFATYKEKFETEDRNVQELNIKLEQLKREADAKLQQSTPNAEEQQIINDLQGKLDVYKTMSHMSILKHTINGLLDIYICSQTGRNGRICYQLTFSSNDNEQRIVQYTPLLDRSDNILPIYMRESFDFPVNDIVILFWRLTTVVNKKMDLGT